MSKARSIALALAGALMVAGPVGGALAMPAGTAGAASSSQGVKAGSIAVGIPYIDYASLKAVGLSLNDGNYPDAYKALIAATNAHGGINGRKLVPYLVAVDPTGSTAADSSCTTLAQDDKVFAVINPEQSDCYLEQYHIPTVMGLFQSTGKGVSTPNFTLLPPAAAYDPLQLSVMAKRGVFKDKKVGIFAGSATDQGELSVVKKALAGLHVHVVETAEDSAPTTDEVAENQQAGVIAQKFQDAGVNEVVAVGTGSPLWPRALAANDSTYNPSWVATNENDLEGVTYGSSSNLPAKYMAGVLTSSSEPSYYEMWKDPAIQQCRKTIQKAYPSDPIDSPKPVATGSVFTFMAVVQACQSMAVFDKVAQAAGKDLTESSFAKAGYGLRKVSFPGSGGAVSFGPNQAYALGPVYLATWDAKAKQLTIAPTSAHT